MYNPIYGHFCPTLLFCPCYTVVQFLFSLWRLMVTLFFNILTRNKKIWKIWLLVLSMIFTWPLSRHSSLRDIFLKKKHPNVQKGPFYPFFYEHVHKTRLGTLSPLYPLGEILIGMWEILGDINILLGRIRLHAYGKFSIPSRNII